MTIAARPTDLAFGPLAGGRARRLSISLRWRATLLLGGVAVLAVVIGSAAPAAALSADPGLDLLLRGMAVIKGLMSAAAFGLVFWRLGRPMAPASAAIGLVACWAMAAAAVGIWQGGSIPLAALAFHGGELSLLVLAWRGRVFGARPGTSAAAAAATAAAVSRVHSPR